MAILQDEIEQWQQNGDEKSLNNGTIFMKCYLVRISGQIKPDGVITFTEEEVIRGEGSEGSRGGVLSGGQYTANLEGNTLEGLSFRNNIKVGHFVLKLAD